MKNIPNILSALRILLIPFFVWQFQIGNTFNAGIIIIFSGITDFLDGFLARRFKWTSWLGKILDPVADKLTLIAVSIVFILNLIEYKNFFIIILAKDSLMLLIGGYLLLKGVKLNGSKWFGKVSTALFYVIMILITLFDSITSKTLSFLIYTITIVEVLSAVMYIPDLIGFYKNKGKNTNNI